MSSVVPSAIVSGHILAFPSYPSVPSYFSHVMLGVGLGLGIGTENSIEILPYSPSVQTENNTTLSDMQVSCSSQLV